MNLLDGQHPDRDVIRDALDLSDMWTLADDMRGTPLGRAARRRARVLEEQAAQRKAARDDTT